MLPSPDPLQSTRRPLPSRPDPETQLLTALRDRDPQATRRLAQTWVHRRGLVAFQDFQQHTLPQTEAPETLAWLDNVLAGAPATPSRIAPGAGHATEQRDLQEPGLDPNGAFRELGTAQLVTEQLDTQQLVTEQLNPARLRERALSAVDRAIEQMLAEFPELELAGLGPQEALELLDDLDGSLGLIGPELEEPPAELLNDPDFLDQGRPGTCITGASEPLAADGLGDPTSGEAPQGQVEISPWAANLDFNGPISFTIAQSSPATPTDEHGVGSSEAATDQPGGTEPEQSHSSWGEATAQGDFEGHRETEAEAGGEAGASEPKGLWGLRARLRRRLPLGALARQWMRGDPAESSTTPEPFPLQPEALGTMVERPPSPAWSSGPAPEGAGVPPRELPAASACLETAAEALSAAQSLPAPPAGALSGAPRPASLADLRAWLPDADLPRAS